MWDLNLHVTLLSPVKADATSRNVSTFVWRCHSLANHFPHQPPTEQLPCPHYSRLRVDSSFLEKRAQMFFVGQSLALRTHSMLTGWRLILDL